MAPARGNVTAVAIGFAGGLVSGLLGVGGGIVMVPGLVLGLSLPQRRAHATSLAAILPIGAVGAALYVRRDDAHYGLAGLLALGSVIGVPLGVRALSRLSDPVLRGLFAAAAGASAVRLLTSKAAEGPRALATALDGSDVWVALAVGVLAGALAGLLGVGGGTIMVPAMTILLAQGQHVAQGTSLLAIIATAIAGTAVNSRRGLLQMDLAFKLGAGGAAGAVAGSLAAGGLADATLKRIFGVFLVLVALRMLFPVRRQTASDG